MNNAYKITALILICAFYISYIVKLLMLKRQNITVDILGKGHKAKSEITTEILLKCTTYLGAAIQFISVIFNKTILSLPSFPTMQEDGLILMLLALIVFIMAIVTMRNNWRAGFSDGQNTNLVTNGIYKFSRNPAFLGFDLLYIGCSLAFPNVLNIIFALVAIMLFHIQIKGEEAFLAKTFGDEYIAYKARTMRYLGRRKHEK